MKLEFIKYNAEQKNLLFQILSKKNELENEYLLKRKLLEIIVLHSDAQMIIKNNNIEIFELKNANHIEFLLLNIKKSCIEMGVENWQTFLEEVKVNLNISNKIKQYDLEKLPNDILHLISAKYIGVFARPAMMRLNKTIYHKINNPEELLKIHYPDIYNAEKKSNKEREPVKKKKYQQLFAEAYAKETLNIKKRYLSDSILHSSDRERRLSILCKQGDLPGLIKYRYTLDDLLSYNTFFLYSAYRNGHKKILDYFYHSPSQKIGDNIFKAIYCFQDQQILSADLKKNNINDIWFFEDLYIFFTPLSFAVKVNHCDAVDFLCHQPNIRINDSIAGWSALDNALMDDNLDMVKYLCEKGAVFNVKSFFDFNSEYEKFFDRIGQKSQHYLFKHPVFALELLQESKSDDEYINDNIDNYRYLSEIFYADYIKNWLSSEEINNPFLTSIVHYFNSHSCESSVQHYRVYFSLIIEHAKVQSAEKMLELIEKIQVVESQQTSYKIDQQGKAIILELRDKFKSLCADSYIASTCIMKK
jgi:hypothetical protein